MTRQNNFIFIVILWMQIVFAPNGYATESSDLLKLKTELSSAKEDTASIRILNDLATSYYYNILLDSCLKYARNARTLAYNLVQNEEVKSNPSYLQKCMVLLADATGLTGLGLQSEDNSAAIDTLKSAMNIMATTGDKNGIASIHQSMGLMYEDAGRNDLALEQYQMAKSIYKETGNKKELGLILSLIGISQRYSRNYGDAIESQIQALEIGEEIKDTLTINESLLALAFTFVKVEKWDEALDYQDRSLKLFMLTNDSIGISRVYSDIGVTYLRMDSLDAALENHLASLAIRLKIHDSYYSISSSYFYIGSIYLKQNRYQKALEYFTEGLHYARDAGISKYVVDCHQEIGNVYRKMNNEQLAMENYREALAVSEKKSDWVGSFHACEAIGDVYLENGAHNHAIKWYNKAVSEAPATAYSWNTKVYKKLADTYALTGNYKKGYENHQLYSRAKDSALVHENSEKIAIMSNRLDYENKQKLQNESHQKIVQLKQAEINRQRIVKNFSLFGMAVILVMAVVLFIRFSEKKKLNIKLNHTLSNLKSTQTQLVQSEKMASLGELTAGIAHEIQNPLNFVNNFSEVSNELIDEMNEEIAKGDFNEAKIIASDVKQNLEKISHHGKRAEAIVKGMLQHSRTSSGVKEPTDINALADEYLRLAYHGLRAKNKSFNAKIETEFDENIGKINIIPQDIGRVVLNLITNAFYAVNEKKLQLPEARLPDGQDYEPTVTVSTEKMNGNIVLKVKDNGSGIPENILDKIFQPFFTTKASGKGTGLGLSLSYDIITKGHGGEMKVESKEGKGSVFIIQLNNP